MLETGDIPRIHAKEALDTQRKEFFHNIFIAGLNIYIREKNDEVPSHVRNEIKGLFTQAVDIIVGEWEDKILDHNERKDRCLDAIDRVFDSAHKSTRFRDNIKDCIVKAYDEYLQKKTTPPRRSINIKK